MAGKIYRGEIYWIEPEKAEGSEIIGRRPGVIVSNQVLNETSSVVEVVFLTTKDKKNMPTHANVIAQRDSIALCEQINSVSKDRICDYIGQVSAQEMADIDRALVCSLGLDVDESDEGNSQSDDIQQISAERDVYRRLYDRILDRVIGV